MKFAYIFATVGAAVAMAAPAPGAEPEARAPAAVAEKAARVVPRQDLSCLPRSCQVSGCYSGDCDYWCYVCGIPY